MVRLPWAAAEAAMGCKAAHRTTVAHKGWVHKACVRPARQWAAVVGFARPRGCRMVLRKMVVDPHGERRISAALSHRRINPRTRPMKSNKFVVQSFIAARGSARRTALPPRASACGYKKE